MSKRPVDRERCGWCGDFRDELAEPDGPCPEAIDHDPATGEPYICGPHQYERVIDLMVAVVNSLATPSDSETESSESESP